MSLNLEICKLKNAMVQRLDMVAIDIEDSYDEIIQVFKTEKLSRMPVYEETIDDIVGIFKYKRCNISYQ